ncbi:MAG: tRNA pseudouridine(38-40) synthase TruA [Chthoniobacterales bacterium]
MGNRLKLVVAYDGAPFAGWQSQKNGNAVQDFLERAFRNILGHSVRVHGAGRTDSGVHALAQIAHADLPDRSLSAARWPAALNASLPPALRVLRCTWASATFHARFDAHGKIYRYRIWNDRILPPLEVGRAWLVPPPLTFDIMKEEAQAFLGLHDFSSFAANRGTPVEDTCRTIDRVNVRRSGHAISVEIGGDGFLYKMVRLMVGALVRVGHDPSCRGEIEKRLQFPERSPATARLVAPAAGLILVRVRY